MPRHQYIGKQSKDYDKNDHYSETVVSFEQICNDPKIEQIRKPNYQGALIDDKCEKMVEEYLENPLLLRFKNRIIIGCLKKNWYIPKANKKNKQKTPMHACMHFYISIPNNL